jgi:hypothetical protein
VPDSTTATRLLQQRPINRYSKLDNEPVRAFSALELTPEVLSKHFGLTTRAAEQVSALANRTRTPVSALGAVAELPPADRERLRRLAIFGEETRLAITDLAPAEGKVMSNKPFAMRVHFVASPLNPPRMVSVQAEWLGDPFVTEQWITPANLVAGYVDVRFGEDQTLPACATTFRASIWNASGSQASFRTTCAVLPSNPFSLSVGPNGDFVTGTWSARGVRHGDAYDTGIAVTLSNGDASGVGVQPQFNWKFWDGGVGGSLVEQGTGSFGGSITVGAHGTWGGWISFHSPNGSGIFNKYNNREDMTIEIGMSTNDGRNVSGTITCRTMFRFGVNITAVAGEDFTNQEWSDLDAAAQVLRTIYERHDVTDNQDDRLIPIASVGGFEIINSFDEFHDLLNDWSGPDSNDNIDAFIVQAISVGGGVDGIDGSVPGPTSHGGGNSGVIASKTGYVDAGGNRRLHSDYLGMLIGHEIGHYLGLEHVSDAGNLMLPSSGTTDTNLTYAQYRTIIQHGWMEID